MTSIDIPNKTLDAGHLGVKSGGPSIGLVLGSGAARGFAHIGVMRALMAHGIKPDIIVGTSMGALVGGCYATDQLDTLEDWARSLTMRRIIGYLDVRIGGSGLIGGANGAAARLGLKRTTLQYRMRKLRIEQKRVYTSAGN